MNNVCFVNTTPFWGGGEKLHLEYANEFKKLGFNTFIAAKKDSALDKKSIDHQLPVFNLSLQNLSFLNPLKHFSFYSFLKKQKIDTVIISSSQDLKFAGLCAKWARVKNIVYLRGLASPISGSILNRYLLQHCVSHIVANSIATKNTILTKLSNHVSSDKVVVIYHGIDLNDFDAKINTQHQLSTPVIIGNAGRLTKQKGQGYLLEVAKFLKNKNIPFKLRIAGDGELKEQLQQTIEREGLTEQVELLGFVKNMEAFMSSIDIFVLSSLWEGFGYVLVEAMAARKPVLGFNLSSNTELIQDQENGYIIEFPNVEDFAQKIISLIQDSSSIIHMGNRGRQMVKERFLLRDRVLELVEYIQKK